jgi:uroporphyrinogen-III synthase
VDVVVSYQRSAPVFDAAELALMAQASADKSVWLFSSSEAVANLQAISLAHSQSVSQSVSQVGHPGIDWSKAQAIATHPRIAQAAQDAGFGVVYQSRPLLADVAASIESLP